MAPAAPPQSKETDEMGKMVVRIGGVVAMLGLALALSVPARADDASAALYKSKCAGCHGPDGAGQTAAGKAMKVGDFHDADVQKMSDADLTNVVSMGKNKMPGYAKTMKPEEIKGLVAYVRELGKK
jgi:mono/diheme cytochrome c family protein